jgi:hypothetical protein
MDGVFSTSCNRADALSWGALKQLWADVADDTPILVAHNEEVADWAQDADVLDTPDGPVARVHAPFAKQASHHRVRGGTRHP